MDQLQKIATILKFSEKPNTGTFSQSVSQGARMKRQINENKSPQKTIGTLKPTESSARVAGSTLKPTESSARVSGNAGNRNITSPTQGTQTYFISNNMDVLNVTSVTDVTAVTDDTAVSDVTSIDVTSVDDLSAVNNTPGPLIVTVTPVNKQAGSSTIVPGPERLESCNRRLQELFERNSSPGPKSKTGSSSTGVHSNVNNVSNNSAINGNETVQCDKQTAQDVQTASSNSILVETNDNLESHGGENSREKSVNERTCPTTQSEFTPSTSRVSDKTSNLEDREPPPKEVPKPPEKPGTSEVTNSNTCDSWYNGAPGVKGGDKLLEKFGIQQSSSTDSTDQEVGGYFLS